MALVLLPSEIARLVLSYLDDEGLTKTYQQFLHECRYLEECKFYIQNGHTIPRTIQGKRLVDFLKLEAEGESTATSKQQADPIREIVKTENSEAQTDIVKFNEYIQSLADARLRITSEQMTANKTKISDRQRKGNEKTNQPLIISSSNTKNNDDVILIRNNKAAPSDRSNNEPQLGNNNAKKPRLLIGKNAEKVPELSYSTLERQLGTIITDASLLMAQQEEQENQEKQQLDSLYNQLVNDPNPIASSTQTVCALSPKKNPHPNVSTVLTNTTNFIQPLSHHQVNIQQQQQQPNQNQQQQALLNYFNQQKSADGLNNLQRYGITTINGLTTAVVPLVMTNNVTTLQPLAQANVYQENRSNGQKIKDIKPRPVACTPSKNAAELFSDIPERPKRGPPKREGPKNKRTYNRVTPTISEIINTKTTRNDQEMCLSQLQLFNSNEVADLAQPMDPLVFSVPATGSHSQPNILRKKQRTTPKITTVVNNKEALGTSIISQSQAMDDNMSTICQASQQHPSQLDQISMQPMDTTIFNDNNSQQPILSVQSLNSRSSSDVQYQSDLFDLLDFTAENTPVKPEDKRVDVLDDLWFNPSPQKRQRIANNQPTTPESSRILRTRNPSQRKMM